jgi:hypothetical protein
MFLPSARHPHYWDMSSSFRFAAPVDSGGRRGSTQTISGTLLLSHKVLKALGYYVSLPPRGPSVLALLPVLSATACGITNTPFSPGSVPLNLKHESALWLSVPKSKPLAFLLTGRDILTDSNPKSAFFRPQHAPVDTQTDLRSPSPTFPSSNQTASPWTRARVLTVKPTTI